MNDNKYPSKFLFGHKKICNQNIKNKINEYYIYDSFMVLEFKKTSLYELSNNKNIRFAVEFFCKNKSVSLKTVLTENEFIYVGFELNKKYNINKLLYKQLL